MILPVSLLIRSPQLINLSIQCLRHLYASQSSAEARAGVMSNHCIARIYKLERVTPEAIAYVAVLVCL